VPRAGAPEISPVATASGIAPEAVPREAPFFPESPLHECSVPEALRHLVQLLPRLTRGLRRRHGEPRQLHGVTLGPRHGSALALLREDVWTVGSLAAVLDLNLATVSGLVADLERVAFVERSADPADRRRTVVRVRAGREEAVDAWLEEATAPIVGALELLTPCERAVLVKAVAYLDAELSPRAGADHVGSPTHQIAGRPMADLAPAGTEAAPKAQVEEDP
jgi:DNA-binding MarR family transcriptional regulator